MATTTTRLLIATPALFDMLNNAGMLVSTPCGFKGFDIGPEGHVICKLIPGCALVAHSADVRARAEMMAEAEGVHLFGIPDEWWDD